MVRGNVKSESGMKTAARFCTSLVFLLAVTFCQAQPSLGFSNLAGFPDVINQGAQYNLSGWIVNRGNAAYTGNVDIEMQANLGNVLSITNNFAISALQPGDSVLWTKNNHNFPPGQFRLGNNDILVWPTIPSMSNVDTDTLGKPVYFTDVAAFRLENLGFETFGEYANVDARYSFLCFATNVGTEMSTEGVELYARMAGHNPVLLAESFGGVPVGGIVEFTVQDFSVKEIFGLEAVDLTLGGKMLVDFFALEKVGLLEPVNMVRINVSSVLALTNSLVDDVKVYPNPSTANLNIDLPNGMLAELLQVRDIQGRLVHTASGTAILNLSDLPAGTYTLEVTTEQALVRRIIVLN